MEDPQVTMVVWMVLSFDVKMCHLSFVGLSLQFLWQVEKAQEVNEAIEKWLE